MAGLGTLRGWLINLLGNLIGAWKELVEYNKRVYLCGSGKRRDNHGAYPVKIEDTAAPRSGLSPWQVSAASKPVCRITRVLGKPALAGYAQVGFLLHEHKAQYEEAESLYLTTIELEPEQGTAVYNLACLKSINGDSDSAFNYLHKAIQNGFDRIYACDDPDLEFIRNDPRFIELIGPCPG